MNIKYSKQKQEMREDPIMEFFFKAKDIGVKHANMFIGITIVLVFGIIFFFVYTQMRQSGHMKAEEAFSKAVIDFNNRNIEKAINQFRIVVENHGSTQQGAESAYLLGSIFKDMGKNDEAIDWYQMAISKKNALGFIAGEAQEGLAACYEAKGDIPKALEILEKALHDDRISYRHNDIRWRMILLNQKINKKTRAEELCREIISDTTATDYRQRAENVLAALSASSG